MTYNKRLPPFWFFVLLFASLSFFIYLKFSFFNCYAFSFEDPETLSRAFLECDEFPSDYVSNDDYLRLYDLFQMAKERGEYHYLVHDKKSDIYYVFFSPTELYFGNSRLYDSADSYFCTAITFEKDPETGLFTTSRGVSYVTFWVMEYRNSELEALYSTHDFYDRDNNLIFNSYPHWIRNIHFFPIVEAFLNSISIYSIFSFLSLALGGAGVFFLGWLGIKKLSSIIFNSIRSGKISI